VCSSDLAIYQSCDVYFYTLAERLGIGRIAKYATMFGLGQKTGIDLPQEVSGVMPSEEWKIKNYKQKWFAGETISVGIGQGAVATTPVQLMRAVGAITSDGVLRRPHVAFPEQLPPQYLQMVNYTEEKQLPIDNQGWTTITDAMADVVNPVGSAPSAHLNGIDFAGKTGSAQTISNTLKAKMANKSAFKDNGWFVGVTPRRNPEVVVSVLVEGGEHGYLAARMAAQVVKAYVEKKRAQKVNVAAASGNEQKSGSKPATTPEAAGTETAKPEPTKRAPEKDAKPKSAEITGLWGGSGGQLHGGRFYITEGLKFHPAIAAPGMEAFAGDAPQFTAAGQGSGKADEPAGLPGRGRRRWNYVPGVFAIIEPPVRSGTQR
jgi:penicillin-binding protein 2